MRKPLLSLLLFLPVFLTAQHEFAPLGATWYYLDEALFPPNTYHTIKLEVTAIDTIQGRSCKRIESSDHWGCSDCYPLMHVYEENGKVYRFIDSTFHLFIDFNAGLGARWSIKINTWEPDSDSLIVQVDSLSWIFLSNGDSLRVQHVSFPNLSVEGGTIWDWGHQITEQLGNNYFMCPQYGVCDPHIIPLVCYSDPTFKQPFDCVAHLANHETAPIFRKGLLYPNPASELVSIRSDLEADAVIFQDILGKQQIRRNTYSFNNLIINDLSPGIYLVHFLQKGKLVGIDKLVVLKH